MSRYIDTDKTELELWDRGVNISGEYQGVWVRFRDIEEVFKNVPTADVVEVVRCKECKHILCSKKTLEFNKPSGLCGYWGDYTELDGFCSYGEKVTG